MLDGLGFTTEAQVKATVLKECPLGDAFEVFLDVVSIFCCDPTYAPVSGWEKATRSMDEDYSATARKVVSSYHQTHCAWYTEGKVVVPGKVLAAFKDADNWNGIGGLDGRRHEIETSANLSAEIARVWVGDKLPGGGRLAPLALKMIDRSVEWIFTVHKHLDMELTKLTQQHIAQEEALILLSEEMIIMYTRIHAIRKSRMEFVASSSNKVDYMVRCIWVTCQVHRVMQEFIQGGLKYNSTIGTAFIRFLTKQTGSNVASGVGGQLKAHTDLLATMKGTVHSAAEAAKEATKTAKEALTRASTANTTADAAKNTLAGLFTKNTTLKR